MPDETSLLDQLEEWLEQQVARNLYDLSSRAIETMERMSNELFETLNVHGPPSISIPFPPFGIKEVPPPPPPPPPPPRSLISGVYGRAHKLAKAHPYALGVGVSLAVTVGLGLGTLAVRRQKMGYSRTRGTVKDGMLKDAIVILSPNPMPPMLWPLTVTLLRAGYVVLVAVPKVDDAEQLEKRLAGLEERSALRVLIYDPDVPSTFPPFHRSLLATLTLRFPSIGAYTTDPYNPAPSHVPSIHAFISLYPLHPNPPTQPSALPALPTLLAPNNGPERKVPRLITMYPSGSTLVTPDSFASQVMAANHRILGENLAVSCRARIISVYIGHVQLPHLHSMILSAGPQLSRRQQAKEDLRRASAAQKASLIKDHILGGIVDLYRRVAGRLGIGSHGRDYAAFERQFLRIVKAPDYISPDRYTVGQFSFLTLALSRLPLFALPRLLDILPTMPGATGPMHASVQGMPAPRKPLSSSASSASAAPLGGTGGSARRPHSNSSSSDHEVEGDGADDLTASMHTTGSASGVSSKGMDSDSGAGSGLDSSWVGLDSAN